MSDRTPTMTRERPRVAVAFLTATSLFVASVSEEPLIRVSGSGADLGSGQYARVTEAFVSDPSNPAKKRSIDADILSVTTSKKLSDPTGTFTLEMVDRGRYINESGFSWEKIIRPNAYVCIDMQRPQLKSYPNFSVPSGSGVVNKTMDGSTGAVPSDPSRVMVGFVDTIEVSASFTGGVPQRRVVVHGRDVGKLLINAEIVNAFAVSATLGLPFGKGLTFLIDGFKEVGNISPTLVLAFLLTKKLLDPQGRDIFQGANLGRGLIDFDIGGEIAYDSVTGKQSNKKFMKANDTLKFLISMPDDLTLHSDLFSSISFEGNYFSFMKGFVGVPWNEMWVDTRYDFANVQSGRDTDRGKTWYASNVLDGEFNNYEAGKREVRGGNQGYHRDDLGRVVDDQNFERKQGQNFMSLMQLDKTIKDAPKVATPLFPDGHPSYATLFVRPCPWPWRGDDNLEKIGIGGTVAGSESSPTGRDDGNLSTLLTSLRTLKGELEAPDKTGFGRWKNLMMHVVPNEDLLGVNRSRTDLDVFTWFWSYSTNFFIGDQLKFYQYAASPPIVYPKLIRQYGVKYLEVGNNFIDFGLETKKTGQTEAEQEKAAQDHAAKLVGKMYRYTRRLADFFCFDYVMWGAQVTIKGNPHIRVGDRVYTEHDGRQWYVEGVIHNFIVYEQFTTTLVLTRGASSDGHYGKIDARPNASSAGKDAGQGGGVMKSKPTASTAGSAGAQKAQRPNIFLSLDDQTESTLATFRKKFGDAKSTGAESVETDAVKAKAPAKVLGKAPKSNKVKNLGKVPTDINSTRLTKGVTNSLAAGAAGFLKQGAGPIKKIPGR